MATTNNHKQKWIRRVTLAVGNGKRLATQAHHAPSLRGKTPQMSYANFSEYHSTFKDALRRVTTICPIQRPTGLGVLWLAIFILQLVPQAFPQSIRSKEEIAAVLAIENLAIKEGVVSGEVRNNAKHELREVQLFIRYTWLWDEERNPGNSDPGTSAYYTLKQTIPPGQKINFIYKPSPPLPKIAGGRFDTSVTIAGFTEVIPQSQK
jgi:hypothetical protein